MSSGSRLLSTDLRAQPLGPPGTDPLACASTELETDLTPGGDLRIGLWEAGPGSDEDVESDEIFLVLEGRGRVEFDDGGVLQLRPGVLAVLRAGDRTRWTIDERLRKLWVSGAPVVRSAASGVVDRGEAARTADEWLMSSDVTSLDLSTTSSAGQWVEGGWPVARTEHLATLGSATLALWETSTGVVVDIERDEVVVVLAGSAWVSFENGTEVELRPGVALELSAGDRLIWTVTEPLRLLQLG